MARDYGHHVNLDPVTDNCLDCGATREMLDDNIVPTCRKFEGPYKRALVILNRQLMCERSFSDVCEREIARTEEEIERRKVALTVDRERQQQLSDAIAYLADGKVMVVTREPERLFTFFTPPGE